MCNKRMIRVEIGGTESTEKNLLNFDQFNRWGWVNTIRVYLSGCCENTGLKFAVGEGSSLVL
jgi:hypothetical protein